MKNLLSILSLVAIFFVASTGFAQDPTQEQEKEQNQTKTAVKTQTKAQNSEQEQEKPQYQNRNRVKTAVKNQAKGQAGKGFIDENGDGYNDNAPDHDGDGIPNGQDKDYDGAKARKGNNAKGFVDNDGDGVNDNALDSDGDGIPNGQDPDYEGPKDGSGRMQGARNKNQNLKGSGECDGTGPKGTKLGGKK